MIINPISRGLFIYPSKEGGMTIPYRATFDHGTYVYVFRHLHFWAFSGSPKSSQKLVEYRLSLKFYAYHRNGSLEDVYYIKVMLYIYVYIFILCVYDVFLFPAKI